SLRERRARIRELSLNRLRFPDFRNDAQGRQAGDTLHLLSRPQRVVELLEQIRRAQSHGEPETQREQDRPREVGRGRLLWHLGLVDDEDVVGADAAGDIDLLLPLQQALVERAVGVDLALQDVVLDAALLQVESLAAERLDATLHLLFLALRRLVARLERVL